MKVKKGIHSIYRSEWLDQTIFIWISACVNCGVNAEEAIRMLQTWLNINEEQLDTDSLKTSFYRSQAKFRKAIGEDRKHLEITFYNDPKANLDVTQVVRETLSQLFCDQNDQAIDKLITTIRERKNRS